MSFQNLDIRKKCEKCDKRYTSGMHSWCKPCQINNFNKFKNWTSGNEKIDNHIQEMQLERSSRYDTVFEWIPYNKLDNVREISKGDYATVYSAIWKDGPLYYNENQKVYTRKSDKKVTL